MQELFQIEDRQGGGAGLLKANELIDLFLELDVQPMDFIKLLPQQFLVPLQLLNGISEGPPGHHELQQALF